MRLKHNSNEKVGNNHDQTHVLEEPDDPAYVNHEGRPVSVFAFESVLPQIKLRAS